VKIERKYRGSRKMTDKMVSEVVASTILELGGREIEVRLIRVQAQGDVVLVIPRARFTKRFKDRTEVWRE
jgi:hypothetical protein